MGKIAEEFRQIACYESDIFGKILPTTAMNYFQEVSTNQGDDLEIGSDFLKESQLAWFLVKYDIRFDNYPTYKQKVRITTEATGMDRYCAVRRFTIEDLNQNPMIIADTQWLLVNRENQKMEPVDAHQEFEVYGCHDKKGPIFKKIPRIKNPTGKKQFEVRFLDIDFNFHVNHVKYMAWAIEALPLEIVKTRELKRAKLLYKSQCFYGDLVDVMSEAVEDDLYRIEIISQDQTLLCQLELTLR